MKCYKVVRYNKRSAVVTKRAAVRYSTSCYVSAPEFLRLKGRHLSAFKTLEAARDYVNARRYLIYAADGREKVRRRPILSPYGISDGEFYEGMMDNWPDGTVFFKRIKLIKRIK